MEMYYAASFLLHVGHGVVYFRYASHIEFRLPPSCYSLREGEEKERIPLSEVVGGVSAHIYPYTEVQVNETNYCNVVICLPTVSELESPSPPGC